MPKFPWTARPDVSPAEDASLAALLAGDEPPADAGAGLLRPVADVLAALTASPGGGELTGLAAAQDEFRRHVPAQARQSHHWRPASLVSRLGLRLGTATAVVVVGLGGAAAAGYAGALPSSWQQFAHATIGAPERGTGHGARAATSSARSTPRPDSLRPAHQPHSGGPTARHASRHHTRPARQARVPAVWPFLHSWPPITPAADRWPLPPRPTPAEPAATPTPAEPVTTPTPAEPVATAEASPSPSNT